MKWGIARTAAVVMLATAGGCLSPRGDAPPMHTYQLSLDTASGEGRPADVTGSVLLVGQPQPHPGFESPRMVYLMRPYELEFYATNQWTDSPARLFAPLLVQSLSQTGTWRAVVALPGSVRGDYRLDSSGFIVQQEFLRQPSLVRMALRGQLVDLKESRVVSTKLFEVEEPAPSEDAYGGVLASNRAAAAMLAQITSWLQSCARHAPECNR